MKKRTLAIVAALALSGSFSLGAFAASKYLVTFNGAKQNVDIQTIKNKPYISLESATALFGGKLAYNSKTKTYAVTSKDYDPNAGKTKSYAVESLNTSGPMSLKITKVSLDPAYKQDKYSKEIAAVVLDVEVKNNLDKKVNWYPEQGTFALNIGEQIDDAILYSDRVGGEFLAGVTKKGRIALAVKGKLDEVNSIQISIDAPINVEKMERIGEELNFTLKFR